MRVLVSDTSVLIDLERGMLLEAAFRLPYEFLVPDLLYKRELQPRNGENLQLLGLRVAELDEEGTKKALTYRKQKMALSLPDAFAIALAHRKGWVLLTGDGILQRVAEAESIKCHGVLWLLDEMHKNCSAGPELLHRGLQQISCHPQCRLPTPEIKKRLKIYQLNQRAA